MEKEQEAVEVGLPATARLRGRGCGGWFAHGGGVGSPRGRGWSAGDDVAEARDESAMEVMLRATVRWRLFF
jgi:hypothetical protein